MILLNDKTYGIAVTLDSTAEEVISIDFTEFNEKLSSRGEDTLKMQREVATDHILHYHQDANIGGSTASVEAAIRDAMLDATLRQDFLTWEVVTETDDQTEDDPLAVY